MRVEGIFPGERPGKTHARRVVYDAFLRALGLPQFRKTHHLVLGGHGGDVRLLLLLGVPPENIFIVDHDSDCISFLVKRYPNCRFLEADLDEAVVHLAKRRVDFGTLNIDLCGNLYESMVYSLEAVTLKLLLGPKTCFSVTLRADRERELQMYVAVEKAKKQVPLNEYSSSLARAVALRNLLRERMQFKTFGFYAYKSEGLSLQQQPRSTNMAILLGGGSRSRKPWWGKNPFRTPEQPVRLHSLIERQAKHEGR